ncbi:MAG: polymer-forming cytoskeletal protein [Pseudomonadota bacterium]
MRIPFLLFVFFISTSALGQTMPTEMFVPSQDTFKAEENVRTDQPVSDDLFATGFSVEINDQIKDDAHLIGFQIEIENEIGGNLYASGALVDVEAPVNGDVTATGFSLDIGRNVDIGGNTRLAARSVSLDGTVRGSASIAADTLKLNGAVMGDMNFFGRTVIFGENARINGKLTYHTPSELVIPASVISSELVEWKSWEKLGQESSYAEPLAEHAPSVWSVVAFLLSSLAVVIVLAMLFLALMPRKVEQARRIANASYRWTAVYGFFTLAALMGMVPAAATTIVGAPLVPFIILFIAVMWLLGYFLGVYTISYRLFEYYFPVVDTNPGKLAALLVGLLVFAVLNLIPILGWLVNLFVLFLGLGAITKLMIGDTAEGESPDLDKDPLAAAQAG